MLKTKEEIKNWLDKHKIINYTINDDLTVDANNNVYLWNKNLAEIPIQFNKVRGCFNCTDNHLISLENSPKIVNGHFYCLSNQLTSLIGSPEEVNGDFWCYNNQLTSLEGCPKIVKGDFNCCNNNLTSLEGSPEIVYGEFWCTYNSLTSLKHLPEVYGELVCDKDLHETREYKIYEISKKLKELA